jgi:hypothetical protein
MKFAENCAESHLAQESRKGASPSTKCLIVKDRFTLMDAIQVRMWMNYLKHNEIKETLNASCSVDQQWHQAIGRRNRQAGESE